MSVTTNNAYGKISISDLAIAKVASHTAIMHAQFRINTTAFIDLDYTENLSL